ncbi:hypothetical protein AAULH_02533, partial [Lactobacillus helveticus MTCC 5463]
MNLIKYISRLVRPDGGSTLKTEQSFAKSVRVVKTQQEAKSIRQANKFETKILNNQMSNH